jgi:class 3 adenylate cyclase
MMVVYGAPLHHDDDTLMAVKSAMAMQRKAIEIDRKLKKRNGFHLRLGIGVSTGKVYSGILGSLRKKEFTSIGMAVNIAARLQGIAKEGEILITEETLQQLPDDINVHQLRPLPVKGIDEPIKIYRVEI